MFLVFLYTALYAIPQVSQFFHRSPKLDIRTDCLSEKEKFHRWQIFKLGGNCETSKEMYQISHGNPLWILVNPTN